MCMYVRTYICMQYDVISLISLSTYITLVCTNVHGYPNTAHTVSSTQYPWVPKYILYIQHPVHSTHGYPNTAHTVHSTQYPWVPKYCTYSIQYTVPMGTRILRIQYPVHSTHGYPNTAHTHTELKCCTHSMHLMAN